MNQRAPIIYREFHDVPRIFLVSYQGNQVLFDCTFDDSLDEYRDVYNVFMMPTLGDRDLNDSWAGLAQRAAKYLGEVPVDRVKFDETRRGTIDTEVLQGMLDEKAV